MFGIHGGVPPHDGAEGGVPCRYTMASPTMAVISKTIAASRSAAFID
jgi:hypothetical protein